MVKKEVLIITDLSHGGVISLQELCEMCRISEDLVNHFIVYDIVHPFGESPTEWSFDLPQVRRVQRALRLQHDLELEMSSLALILDLLDELEALRARNALFEKHFTKI